MSSGSTVKDNCLVLMAHGSKNANWLVPFEQLTDGLKRDLGEQSVHLCYMEFASPTLEEMAQQLHDAGIRHIRLLPLFLAKGSHLCQDVPNQLTALKRQIPDLLIDLLPPVGENPQFTEMLRAVVKQYIQPQ